VQEDGDISMTWRGAEKVCSSETSPPQIPRGPRGHRSMVPEAGGHRVFV
jgi:hypothetical protein